MSYTGLCCITDYLQNYMPNSRWRMIFAQHPFGDLRYCYINTSLHAGSFSPFPMGSGRPAKQSSFASFGKPARLRCWLASMAARCSHTFLLGLILEIRYILEISDTLLQRKVTAPPHCSGSGLRNCHLVDPDMSDPSGGCHVSDRK